MDTYYLKSLIFDLTILEYEVLCVELPNSNKHRLINKAFKKTNSLRKIQLLSKKYKGDAYYKQHKSILDYLYYKKSSKVPPILKYIQGQKFLEKYRLLEVSVKDYSKKEIKTIFNNISKDQLEKSITCNPN
ncbi:MAG: hypothetical protein E6Z53_21165 [Pantoea sp.]|nr:hypothetical protein [Pantoea sp.]